jgi:hypothetical protein
MLLFGFYDQEGNEYPLGENEGSHIALAIRIVDKKYKEEFEKSDETDKCDFLMYKKGYIKVGNECVDKITYCYRTLSEIQKRIVIEYKIDGWSCDELSLKNREI